MTATAIPSIVGQVIQLQLQANTEDWLGLFDRLELWHSYDGEYFQEVTAPTWRGARVPRDGGDLPLSPPSGDRVNLVGETLSLFLNEQTQVDVTFTGSNPLSYAQAATQVNAATPLVTAWVDEDGRFVVQSVQAGSIAILRVLPTTASSLLGLPTTEPGWFNYGLDARIQLIEDVNFYPVTQHHCHTASAFKTRFSNSFNNTTSEFSTPFYVEDLPIIDTSLTITGFLDLVDLRGRPVYNREVAITTKFMGTVLGGSMVTPTDQRLLTDRNGHVEVTLIRGMSIVVSIAGTNITRDITVPSDPLISSFNLLDPAVGSDDVFNVQVPDVDFAVRRTL